MRLGGKKTLKKLEEDTKRLPKTALQDETMYFLLERFMTWTRKDFRGHKAEISPRQLDDRVRKFALAYGARPSELIWELQKKGFVEVSAADTFILRYDLVRR